MGVLEEEVTFRLAGEGTDEQEYLDEMEALVAEGLGYRNDGAVFAAQAGFNGYKGTYATKLLFNTALPTLAAGDYLVKSDADHFGLPYAHRVSGAHAVVDSWGVPLYSATGALEMHGPIIRRGTGNRNIVEIPATDVRNGGWFIEKWENLAQNPNGTRPNEGIRIGFDGGTGKHAGWLSHEQIFYPPSYPGQRWTEWHNAIRFENGEEMRVISIEADVDRTDGEDGKIVRFRIESDLINWTTPEAGVYLFATPTQFFLQNGQFFDTSATEGQILQARFPDDGGTMPLVSADQTVTGGAVVLGNNSIRTRIPQTLEMGDGGTFAARFTIHANSSGGLSNLITLKQQGVVDGNGTAVVGLDESGALGRLAFVRYGGNLGAVYLEAGGALARVFGAYGDGDVEVLADGAGMILSAPNGTRYRHSVSNGGAPVYTAV